MSTTFPTSSVTATYSEGFFVVTMAYTRSIQNENLELNFAPPPSYDHTFDMRASSVSFTVDPINAKAYYYSDSTYSGTSALKTILKIFLGISFLTFALGFGLWKMVGIESVQVVQAAFLASCIVP